MKENKTKEVYIGKHQLKIVKKEMKTEDRQYGLRVEN